MALVSEFLFFLFCQVMVVVLVAGDNNGYKGECPPSFHCGYLGNITFPFTKIERLDCGVLPIWNCDAHDPHTHKMIQLLNQGNLFPVISVSPLQADPTMRNIQVRDLDLYRLLQSRSCEAFRNNYTIPPTFHFTALRVLHNVSLFKCNRTLHVKPPTDAYKYTNCSDFDLYYTPLDASPSSLAACTEVQLPIKDVPDATDPFTFLAADFFIEVKVTDQCANCHYHKKGQCQLDSKGGFCCANAVVMKHGLSRKAKLGIGLGIGIPGILIIGLMFLFLLYKRKHATSGRPLEPRNSFSDSSINSRRESSSVYFGVPLFSYGVLKEATNNFHHTKELGDGGFGTVYYGKLPDGREVAVKRLYEHNYRRVEQFMNEIEILTRLRHKNLVSLYGCTSRHSRELLLVYEYISNGTVACHLHGELAKPGLPPWSTRIKIAIETASALVYLHASEIVHRDVKSNNILLDNNYGVKVADFGLSRLFPYDVTHVSTAPQGSPGYLDPEYYQHYQLTSKSDVYSFGVLLIELISSKPAVDMNRNKDEINLSNLAIKKIQEGAIGELVDPCLGFDSDNEVNGMIVSVAALAFQCLQREKESRPSMDEVLQELRRIQGRKDEAELQEEANIDGVRVSQSNAHPPPPASPEWDEVGLLKNMKLPTSPNTVTEKWESKHTTPNVSV